MYLSVLRGVIPPAELLPCYSATFGGTTDRLAYQIKTQGPNEEDPVIYDKSEANHKGYSVMPEKLLSK